MATTTGSHGVASFTAPVNGTSPIDANSVRNNDNALRSAYVNHDSDTGIHVQSSSLATRPAAGVAGRKWITADTGSYKLWYDTGSIWEEVSSIAAGSIVNADVSASAAIDYSKLASLPSANLLVGSSGNVPTARAITGDVTINNTGVTAIASGVIVNADVNASAAIDYSKLASLTSGNILVGSSSNVATSRAMSGDVTISNTGVTSVNAAFSKIIKTYMVGSVDLTGGGTVTVFTASVPSIAAGDIIEVSFQGARLNNSGSIRIWTYTMSLGSASVSIATANHGSSVNKRPDALVVRFGCVSAAQTFVYGDGGLAVVYKDDAVDITGTNTLTVSIDIDTAGSNQTLEAVMANVRLIKAV